MLQSAITILCFICRRYLEIMLVIIGLIIARIAISEMIGAQPGTDMVLMLGLLEGTTGALLSIASLILMLIYLFRKKWRSSILSLSICLILFVFRAFFALFCGSFVPSA